MTLEELKFLLEYNNWANNQFFERLARLDAARYMLDRNSSHGSIHGTMTHIVAAQKLWLSRCKGMPEGVLMQGKDVHSLAELKTIWDKVRAETDLFIAGLTTARLQEAFLMKTSRGDEFCHTFEQAMMQVVNHSSYHRGQISAFLRQIGEKAPATDLIVFHRRKQFGVT